MKINFRLHGWEIKNIRIYYLLTFVLNSWWVSGNWIFFWTRYMTFGTLGIIDALAFGFGILAEIPSGAIADMLGKRRTIITSMFLATIGIFLLTHTMNSWGMLVGFLIAQLGWALYSGAAEAMAYDTLVDIKRENEFEKIISTSTSAAIGITVVTTLVGGILYATYYQLPHIAWWITYLLGFVISFGITEPKTDTEKFSWSGYLRQLKMGFSQLSSKNLRRYLIFIFGLYGSFIIYDWGLVKPSLAEHFGYFANEQAIIFSILGLIGTVTVSQLPKIRKIFGDVKGLYVISLVIGMAYMLMFLNLGYFGLLAIATIDIAGRVVYPWLSVIINKQVDSRYRATTISTGVLLSRLPYVLVAIFAGQSAENGTLNVFALIIGIILLSLTVFNFMYFRGKAD